MYWNFNVTGFVIVYLGLKESMNSRFLIPISYATYGRVWVSPQFFDKLESLEIVHNLIIVRLFIDFEKGRESLWYCFWTTSCSFHFPIIVYYTIRYSIEIIKRRESLLEEHCAVFSIPSHIGNSSSFILFTEWISGRFYSV